MQDRFEFATTPHETDRNAPISVSQLNVLARRLIERSLPLLWVSGEISNFTRSASGHCYFSLKDERAQVRCVFFRHRTQQLDWTPVNGIQVEVRACPTLYEARGEFQLTVDFMRRAGLGALYETFARLKEKLEQEGLFDARHKKRLPAFPTRIGLITSPAAAALRDVLTTLRRRMPGLPVVLYPTPVQGDGAAYKIAAAIDAADARRECEVLILCRGGGTIEDLWAFNQEAVARAVYRCSIPLVCGVGHDTDFSIADFVADARAPSPTGAAELVSPNRAELTPRVRVLQARLRRAALRNLERRMQQADYLGRRLVHPGEKVRAQLRHLAHCAARLRRAVARRLGATDVELDGLRRRIAAAAPDPPALEAGRQRLAHRLSACAQHALERRGAALARLDAHLTALSPQHVLERGYSIVTQRDGRIVRDAAGLAAGEELSLTFARGGANAQVTRTRR
jgi:exodeoxyribonuclease VII large subunit